MVRLGTIAVATLAFATQPAAAGAWTHWSKSSWGGAVGRIDTASGPVTVRLSGAITYFQPSGPAAPATWWEYFGNPWAAYASLPDRPQDSGVAAPGAGFHVITFSRPVSGVTLLTLSLGQLDPNYWVQWAFDRPFTVTGHGLSYFGDGALFDVGGNVLEGHEGSGVVDFGAGTIRSIAFTMNRDENWSGLTIGAAGVAVPEPAGLALFGLCAGALIGARRRSAR